VIQYLENHQKNEENSFPVSFFPLTVAFLLVMQKQHIDFTVCVWKNIAITARAIGLQFIFTEGGYKNEPDVLSSIHFVSEEEMVFLSVLTRVSMRH
jgi:hypothetical protein